MNTANNSLTSVPSITAEALRNANFSFEQPFYLPLTGGQIFQAEKIVRILPNKRLVAFGTWNHQAAVIKIFFHSKHAKRHMEREIAGHRILKMQKIPTPNCYYEGVCQNKNLYAVVYQNLREANSIDKLWRERIDVTSIKPILQHLVIELATQHVLGVVQHDLHLKNFMLADKVIYSLDGDQVELKRGPLAVDESMHYLALFLAQLGMGVAPLQEELFQVYAKARSLSVSKEDNKHLLKLIEKFYKKRWLKYKKKIFKSSSRYARFDSWRLFGMYAREYATPQFLNLLHDLNHVFHHPNAKILKTGNSATVVNIELDGRKLVVKRYNLKSMRHFLRRCLRHSRAHQSWLTANKLDLFGIAALKPVAFVEKRFLGLRHVSYFIYEYVEGESVADYLDTIVAQPEKLAQAVIDISQLILNVKHANLSHGDLKAANILVDATGRPQLIDLDGAREHQSAFQLHGAFQKDCQRFLRNFASNPNLREKFKMELGDYSSPAY